MEVYFWISPKQKSILFLSNLNLKKKKKCLFYFVLFFNDSPVDFALVEGLYEA